MRSVAHFLNVVSGSVTPLPLTFARRREHSTALRNWNELHRRQTSHRSMPCRLHQKARGSQSHPAQVAAARVASMGDCGGVRVLNHASRPKKSFAVTSPSVCSNILAIKSRLGTCPLRKRLTVDCPTPILLAKAASVSGDFERYSRRVICVICV